MSRSAHAQSTYKLQEMPRCKRCKSELIYVMAKYDGENDYRMEWECTKCHKILQDSKIRLPKQSEQDMILHKWITNGIKQNRNNRRTHRRNK